MPGFSRQQRLGAEFLGTALLLATVIGSGIMGERLAGGNVAIALLGNTIPTGAILVVLITMLGPISGAHFNPAVTAVFAIKGEMSGSEALGYVVVQILGGIVGVLAAHAMFDEALAADLNKGEGRAVAVVLGMGCRVWPGSDHSADAESQRCCCRHLRRALHHGGLLVHRIDVVRQSRRDHRASLLQYLRRHSSAGCAAFRYRAADRSRCGRLCLPMASGGTGRGYGQEVASGVEAMTVTIYHNPSCGTSRNTLAMIRQSGEEPEVIEYLKTPPTRERLIELLRAMNMRPRELLRRKGTPYDELGLDDPKWSDDELIALMLEHPILINRPIVVTPKGVRLCRPSELVLDILPNPDIGTFTKEDGEVITPRKEAHS